MDADAAAELLAEAGNADAGEPTQTQNNQPEPTAPPSGADEGQTANAESFMDIDPNSLPPELLAQYRNMQAHFTRKTQDLAERSNALEGLDPREAREAVDFIQALNSDPNFAQQVHQQLTQALVSAGLTPDQAAQAATNELAGNNQAADWQDEGTGIPPEVLQRIERAEQFMESFQETQLRQEVTADIDRQESELRRRYPEWDDKDIESVYNYAFANGGNLLAGADAYVSDQSRIISRLTNQKHSVPTGAPRQAGMGFAPDAKPKTLKEATAAGIEMFKNSLAD